MSFIYYMAGLLYVHFKYTSHGLFFILGTLYDLPFRYNVVGLLGTL